MIRVRHKNMSWATGLAIGECKTFSITQDVKGVHVIWDSPTCPLRTKMPLRNLIFIVPAPSRRVSVNEST